MLHVKNEIAEHKKILDTPADIEYYIRLNPDMIESAMWRRCSADEYFAARFKNMFGGLLQAKTIIKFFDSDFIQEI